MINMAIFSTGGSNISPTSLYAGGYPVNVQLPAQNLNYFLNQFSTMAQDNQNAVTIPATGYGGSPISLNAADTYQLLKASIAMSHLVGENIESEVAQTPVGWTSATFSSNATWYRPIVSRQVDQTLTATVYPDLVSTLRAEQLNLNNAGANVNSWTGVATSGVFTLSSITGANLLLLNLLTNDAIVNGFITNGVGAAAVYGSRTLTIAGTEYTVTAVNLGTGAISCTGLAAAAGTTATVFPYRIAGSATSAFLPKIGGLAGVTQYDYEGTIGGGFRKPDQIQGHVHNRTQGGTGELVWYSGGGGNAPTGGSNNVVLTTNVGDPVADTHSNGTPRTGKSTDPRSRGIYVYTWAGRYLA